LPSIYIKAIIDNRKNKKEAKKKMPWKEKTRRENVDKGFSVMGIIMTARGILSYFLIF
jgi:hypothetical protein